ncbi:BSD domain-containing family protein [Striga asiatica]|uniref:BSD domain-containing family protein n=1 Tax=Striga asiatica TaxID=4170 RepID=A0A5A7PEK1_STRAF|nr:BSD domain-containing family protein [Striga asiatica]
MAWWARSIANTLKFDDDDDDDDVNAARKPESKQSDSPESRDDDVASPVSPSRGVKEDLSELSKTLTRQFWGVASFLAPPPQPEPQSDPGVSEPDQSSILGIRSDFAEIGGKFRSGISRLSNNINVSEITKLASNLLQLESDDENEGSGVRESFESFGEGAVGVTEKVLAFVLDIAVHPETWLDFPLPEDIADMFNADFDMTDAQQEHALAVERLVPRLAVLRMELCPGYMSESCFWLIYFLLLHTRLDKQDAKRLSTPQVLEARALLGHELKNKNTTEPRNSSGQKSPCPEESDVSHHEESLSMPSPVIPENEPNKTANLNISTSGATAAPKIVKDPAEINETKTANNSVTQEKEASQVKEQYMKKSNSSSISVDEDEDDADDWLKEETLDAGSSTGKSIPIVNEDDVTFSDLEDDDGDVPASHRKSNDSSDKDSRDWVQLGKSSSDKESTKESNDWLDVDDIVVS